METNRADRLADALASALGATDRRSLLESTEPAMVIAQAIRCQPGSLGRDFSYPTSCCMAGSGLGVQE
jgi:hypothetical protein